VHLPSPSIDTDGPRPVEVVHNDSVVEVTEDIRQLLSLSPVLPNG